MKTLTLCQGLPASGKTTWARQYQWNAAQAGQRVERVNQDDIRKELGWTDWASWDFKGPQEQLVHKLKRKRIEAFLQDPLVDGVISDDTNLSRKNREWAAQIAAKYGAIYTVKQFLTTPETCIVRDCKRIARVGSEVIMKMAEQSKWPPSEIDYSIVQRASRETTHLMRAIICDLDGTLALMNGRSPYDASTCERDTLNFPVADCIRRFHDAFYQIIYLSGREDKYRPQTEAFLLAKGCPAGPLWMRTTGDMRKDWIVKSELFDAHINDRYNVVFALDDRNQVVNMWRAKGVTCFQVAEGAF